MNWVQHSITHPTAKAMESKRKGVRNKHSAAKTGNKGEKGVSVFVFFFSLSRSLLKFVIN